MFTFNPANSVDDSGNVIVNKNDDSAEASVNFDTFLNLLVTQVQNQDPLKPQDPTEFTNQIARYSSLEQQIKSNTLLENMAASNTQQSQAALLGYIGKEVMAEGDTTAFSGESDTSVDYAYTLDKPGVKTVISVYNEEKEKVFETDGKTEQGQHVFRWGGANEEGELQPAGNYRVVISSTGTDGKPLNVQTMTFKKAIGVETQDGNTSLVLADGALLSPDKISTIRESK